MKKEKIPEDLIEKSKIIYKEMGSISPFILMRKFKISHSMAKKILDKILVY